MDKLPEGWEERKTPDGLKYWANPNKKLAQWKHPQAGNPIDGIKPKSSQKGDIHLNE